MDSILKAQALCTDGLSWGWKYKEAIGREVCGLPGSLCWNIAVGKGAGDFLTIITREISSGLLAVSKEGCSSSSSRGYGPSELAVQIVFHFYFGDDVIEEATRTANILNGKHLCSCGCGLM